MYKYYSIQLKFCKKSRKYREYSPELREAIRKLDKFINKQRFCGLYRIDTYEQAEGLKARRKEQISELAEERKKLRLEQNDGREKVLQHMLICVELLLRRRLTRCVSCIRMCECVMR